ncbi:MAG: Gfo/Idh/MocA family protein [Candidatus Eiseniibacteriota bacterium]
MAKKVLKAALVGVGVAGQVSHIPAWKKLEGVELVALCDRDQEKALRVAQRFGVPVATSNFEDILADPEIDVVDVCTPNYLHAPLAIAALQSGKHVLVERPIARTAAETEKMVKAADKADRLLVCALAHRFREDTKILKKFVDRGELGDVFYTKAGWLRQRTDWRTEEWRQQKQVSGGGVLMDLGVQMLDLALHILGAPAVESVTASAHRAGKAEVEDSCVALIRLEGGGVLNLEVTWGLLMERDFAYVNLFGQTGAALWNPLRIHKGMHGSLVNVTPAVDSPRNVYKQAIEAQIAHFADCVRKGTAPGATGAEMLEVMRLVDAIYRSAEQGREVRLAQSS